MVKKRCIFYIFRPVCNALSASTGAPVFYSFDSALPSVTLRLTCSRKSAPLFSEVLIVLTMRRESETVTFGTAFT
jgi:hypothetical protein